MIEEESRCFILRRALDVSEVASFARAQCCQVLCKALLSGISRINSGNDEVISSGMLG